MSYIFSKKSMDLKNNTKPKSPARIKIAVNMFYTFYLCNNKISTRERTYKTGIIICILKRLPNPFILSFILFLF